MNSIGGNLCLAKSSAEEEARILQERMERLGWDIKKTAPLNNDVSTDATDGAP